MSFALDIAAAYQAGRQAAQEDAARSTCPHAPNTDDPRTRNAFTSWMRGYASIVPTPVDYSD